jgi:hypothetical protein
MSNDIKPVAPFDFDITKEEATTDGVTNPSPEIEKPEYIIDPAIQGMFPPVEEERYNELKESIRNAGVLYDLVVWEETGILLDGHTRHQIYHELREELGEEFNIKPPKIIRMSFASREDAEWWVLQNQFIRRNMNVFQRVEFALRFKDSIAAKAKANQRAAGGAVPQTCGKAVDTNKELGKLAGTNAEMVRKVKTILKRATPAEIKALRQDDVKINTVFKKYDSEDKKQAYQPSPVSCKQPDPEPEPQPCNVPESVAEPLDEPSIEHEPETILPLEANEEQSQNLEEQIDEYIVLLDEFVAERSLPEERVRIRERIREWANSGESDIIQPLE